MTILATILFTALVMGYPLHRAVIQRDEARKQAELFLGLVLRGTPVRPGSEGAKVLPFGGRG